MVVCLLVFLTSYLRDSHLYPCKNPHQPLDKMVCRPQWYSRYGGEKMQPSASITVLKTKPTILVPDEWGLWIAYTAFMVIIFYLKFEILTNSWFHTLNASVWCVVLAFGLGMISANNGYRTKNYSSPKAKIVQSTCTTTEIQNHQNDTDRYSTVTSWY